MKEETKLTGQRRFICVVPSCHPVGGIAKALDYAVHASRIGFSSIFAPLLSVEKSPLFEKPYYLEHSGNIMLSPFKDIEPRQDDVVFFSLPSNYRDIIAKYSKYDLGPRNLIHIVQNVRHTNVHFDNGYAFRLLSKPMTRICITSEVYEEVTPWVDNADDLHLINHGFDFDFFERSPTGSNEPLSLCFNRFKGDLGEKIALEAEKRGLEIEFRRIERGISWGNLRDTYQRSTVFLGTPLKEEGLYLPSLEAMASGCLVIMSDAIGSRFYTRFGENCIEVPYADVGAYVDVLQNLTDDWEKAQSIRRNAYLTAFELGMESEFRGLVHLLDARCIRKSTVTEIE